MNRRITELRSRLQSRAGQMGSVVDVWQGPGEEDFTEEFTVLFEDGVELHVQIQEGSCPAK